jgi:hypothetical protein
MPLKRCVSACVSFTPASTSYSFLEKLDAAHA